MWQAQQALSLAKQLTSSFPLKRGEGLEEGGREKMHNIAESAYLHKKSCSHNQ